MAKKPRGRNRKAKAETSEQMRVRDGGSFKGKTAYSYSSRRSEEEINLGRRADGGAKARIAKTTHYGLKRIGYIILLIAVLASLIKVLSLSSTARIVIVAQKNNALIARTGAATYQAAAQSYLSNSMLNGNKITIDASGLSNYLLDKYPELGSVSVNVPFVDNHLVVYLTPTMPALLLVEPSATYALDANGRVILEGTNVASLKLNLPVVTDQSGLDVALGKMALTSTNVSFIDEVTGQLEAKSFHISQMTLPADTDELDVSLTGEPYYIKFNLEENDPRQQAGTFLATIAELKGQNITPSKYVDVRVDGRAYYQ